MIKLKIISLLCLAIALAVVSCQSDAEIEFKRYYTSGSVIYQTRCQNCHGKNGEGLLTLMPPLTDTVFIAKNRAQLPCYLQNGLSGIINVSGKFFDNKMPPANLAPIEIAEVLTYVGNSFGNKTGVINLNEVEKSLKACK
ncbi:hypothetical protein GCM10023149_40600 [Mucilaginibacter gynuensis]|uniref:Cytochrome c domain-containing protein n=1 Tax=Mucilaginibacter gynuensis TaxID=1302236 RepID=A0ABP8H330_9SPHI